MPRRLVFDLVDQHTIVEPGNLCSSLLHNLLLWPDFSESPHVLEVSRAKTLHVWELALEVVGESLNDLRSPTLGKLGSQDSLPNVPIKQYEFGVDGNGCSHLGGSDALLQLFPEGAVFGWDYKAGVIHEWFPNFCRHCLQNCPAACWTICASAACTFFTRRWRRAQSSHTEVRREVTRTPQAQQLATALPRRPLRSLDTV